jgi:hypothetical protein
LVVGFTLRASTCEAMSRNLESVGSSQCTHSPLHARRRSDDGPRPRWLWAHLSTSPRWLAGMASGSMNRWLYVVSKQHKQNHVRSRFWGCQRNYQVQLANWARSASDVRWMSTSSSALWRPF